jgi:hypothetical protein
VRQSKILNSNQWGELGGKYNMVGCALDSADSGIFQILVVMKVNTLGPI